MKNNDQVGTIIDPHNQNSNINFQNSKTFNPYNI